MIAVTCFIAPPALLEACTCVTASTAVPAPQVSPADPNTAIFIGKALDVYPRSIDHYRELMIEHGLQPALSAPTEELMSERQQRFVLSLWSEALTPAEKEWLRQPRQFNDLLQLFSA